MTKNAFGMVSLDLKSVGFEAMGLPFYACLCPGPTNLLRRSLPGELRRAPCVSSPVLHVWPNYCHLLCVIDQQTDVFMPYSNSRLS